MTPLERNKFILRKYIPDQSVDIISDWINIYNFKLKVKRARTTKEGDYTSPRGEKNHVITINRDLNKYAFLVTLIHEIAHLVTWEKRKGKVLPHGKEWKLEYVQLLNYFLKANRELPVEKKIFPNEISIGLYNHILQPSASSCSDLKLSRLLKKFDAPSETILLEKISIGTTFKIAQAKTKHATEVFIKGEKRRTRYKCLHAQTKREYLIHALCKVVII